MLKPLTTLREKLSSFLGPTPAAVEGIPGHAPAWPAPARKPEPVAPKLSLARRVDRGGSAAGRPMLAAPAGSAQTLAFHRSEASR